MRRSLPTEVLMASQRVNTPAGYGTHYRYAVTAEELYNRAHEEPTWANQLMALTMSAVSQEDTRALRTALVSVAGRAICWISEIDNEEGSAA